MGGRQKNKPGAQFLYWLACNNAIVQKHSSFEESNKNLFYVSRACRGQALGFPMQMSRNGTRRLGNASSEQWAGLEAAGYHLLRKQQFGGWHRSVHQSKRNHFRVTPWQGHGFANHVKPVRTRTQTTDAWWYTHTIPCRPEGALGAQGLLLSQPRRVWS